jgi:hypothetical protein
MMSWWVWLLVGVAAMITVGALRWTLADFVLDRFGSRPADWPTDRQRPEVEPARLTEDASIRPTMGGADGWLG